MNENESLKEPAGTLEIQAKSVGLISTVAVAAAFAGAPGLVVAACGVACASLVLWLQIRRLVIQRRDDLSDWIKKQRNVAGLGIADDVSHNHSEIAAIWLEMLASRLRSLADQAYAPVADELEKAAERVRKIRVGIASDVDLSAQNPLVESSRDQRSGALRRFADHVDLGWIPSEPMRRPLHSLAKRVSRILDEVRLVHTAQIEDAVLQYTLYARAVLICSAPLITLESFGRAPLEGGPSLSDIPWGLAAAWAAVTALAAVKISRNVMARDSAGDQWRKWLLFLEIPLATAATLATPCWPVAAFAVGWTNWLQRPNFTLRKLAIFALSVSGTMAFGMLGSPVNETAVEIATSLLVIALIGNSYGAMLPISISIFIRACFDELLGGANAQRRAEARLKDAVIALRLAAETLTNAADGDERIIAEAKGLLELADSMTPDWRQEVVAGFRSRKRVMSIIDGVISSRGKLLQPVFTEGFQMAAALAAADVKEPPLSLGIVQAYDGKARVARFRRRSSARSFRQLVVAIVSEAMRHGTGSLDVRVRTDCEAGILVFDSWNKAKKSDKPGDGSGAGQIQALIKAIDNQAELVMRGPAGREFTGSSIAGEVFFVRITLPLSCLK